MRNKIKSKKIHFSMLVVLSLIIAVANRFIFPFGFRPNLVFSVGVAFSFIIFSLVVYVVFFLIGLITKSQFFKSTPLFFMWIAFLIITLANVHHSIKTRKNINITAKAGVFYGCMKEGEKSPLYKTQNKARLEIFCMRNAKYIAQCIEDTNYNNASKCIMLAHSISRSSY